MPDPSFVIPLFLQSALLPFGVALAVLAASRKPAFALAAGFLASYFAVFHAQWSFAPHQVLDWMPWIALLGAAAAIAGETVRPVATRTIARALIATAAAAVVVWPALASLGLVKAVLIVVAAAALICAAWSWLAHAADSRPTPAPLLTIVAGGAALALMVDASQAIGQLSGALAAALAACVAFNLVRRRIAFDGAANGVAVLLLGALLVNAYLYAGFSLAYVALLAGGLLADPLVAVIDRARRRSGRAWVAATVLCAIPVLTTIGLALKTAQESGGY